MGWRFIPSITSREGVMDFVPECDQCHEFICDPREVCGFALHLYGHGKPEQDIPSGPYYLVHRDCIAAFDAAHTPPTVEGADCGYAPANPRLKDVKLWNGFTELDAVRFAFWVLGWALGPRLETSRPLRRAIAKLWKSLIELPPVAWGLTEDLKARAIRLPRA